MRTKEQIKRELQELAEQGLAAAKRKDIATSASLIPKTQALMRELDPLAFQDLIDRGDDLIERFGDR